MVERNLAKVEVESSRLFSRSSFERKPAAASFFIARISGSEESVASAASCRWCLDVKPCRGRPVGAGVAWGADCNLAEKPGVRDASPAPFRQVDIQMRRHSNPARAYALGQAFKTPKSRSICLRRCVGIPAFVFASTQLQYRPRRGSKVVMQRPAKPCTPVRTRPPPPCLQCIVNHEPALVAGFFTPVSGSTCYTDAWSGTTVFASITLDVIALFRGDFYDL